MGQEEMPRRRSWLRALPVLALAVAAWWLLGFWLPGGSERFYLLVPPVGLALMLAFAAEPWRELKRRLRATAPLFGLVILFCVAFNLVVTIPSLPLGVLGGLRMSEVLVAAYFILALRMLALAPLKFLRGPFLRLHDRLFGMDPEAVGKLPQWRADLRRLGLELLLAPLLVPLLLGTLYVHRFKVPNLSDQQQIAGWPRENVAFNTDDGLTMRGWFFPSPKGPSGRTLIICHGMGGNRSLFLPFLSIGEALDANVLMFDFRGHGDSDGHTVSFGMNETLDVLAAVRFLRTEKPEQARQIVGLGVSMGTAGLIRAAAEVEPPLDAVVIDSGYASAPELADNVLYVLPAFIRPVLARPAVPLACLDAGCWLYDMRPIDNVAHLRAPVLIIHDADDQMIPVANGHRLYEAASEPKALWITEGLTHGRSIHATAEYARRVTQQLVEKRAQ